MHLADKIDYQIPATPYAVTGRNEHLASVLGRLRKCDADEVFAATGKNPDVGLCESWTQSGYRWAIVWRGEIIGLFGMAFISALGPIAVPWLLGTDKLSEIKLSFVRESRRYIDFMLTLYPVLGNYVDARNLSSIKWLDSAGFEIASTPVPFGPFGMPFHYFEKRRA